MLTLIKLLKTLNSTQTNFQLSLALIFGMFSGFLPFFSLINAIVVLVVFSLNIPLGVYVVFTVMFSMLGALLDNSFATFGYMLLTDSSLNNLWTTLYNFTPALWFNFNHTITLGSFMVSLIMLFPLYFISKPLFNHYRNTLIKLSQKIKIFRWFILDIDTTKKVKLFRWWGSGLIIAIFLIVVLFSILLFDPIIKYSLEYLLSKATKSEVSIKNVNTNFRNTTFKFSEISIINDKQISNIKHIIVDLDTDHLINKKLDIKSIDIKDISLNNKLLVQTSYNKAKTSQQTKNTDDKGQASDIFKFNLLDIDAILNKEDLKSIKESKMIQQRFNDINKKWKDIEENKINNIDTKNLNDDFKNIKVLGKNIKSLEDIKHITIEIKEFKNKISVIQEEINVYKEEYKKDKDILNNDLKQIKTLPNDDYKYLISKYSLNQNSAFSIVSTYIGKDMSKYIKIFIGYLNMIKPYLPSSEDDDKIIRQKGQWITFKVLSPYPTFVLQNLNANIVSKKFDDCRIYLSYNVDTKININVSHYKQNIIKLDKKLHLKDNIVNFNANVNIKKFDNMSSIIDVNFIKTNFIYKDRLNKYDMIIKNILNDIDMFYIESKITTSLQNTNDMKISIVSDIDRKLKNGLKKESNKQILEYKRKLKLKLKEKIRANIGNISNEDFEKYSNLLNDKENLLRNIQKELVFKYNIKNIKDKLNKQYKNKLKKFFNKSSIK
ncbi:hypothetical protein MNB_ARC-1_1057 [hydrothermal vent metagenome]|uniref:DUF2062 domain-containing protein n=1 Tax=hydrothermal vent metagenome TaxID=652676 RepID=A0A3B1DSA8_9ZZZZ